ncbi:hypothetical protein PTKIN_Ptkin05aG0032900 [Pterospermum kingtungense]
MGLPIVAIAKLHLLSHCHKSFTPLLAGLICPFLLKLSFGFGVPRGVYTDVVEASRLFFFQLNQIAFDADHQPAPGRRHRWQRALRLVCQRITHVRRSPAEQLDDESFHTLSMLSL